MQSCPVCGHDIQRIPNWRSLKEWEYPLRMTLAEFRWEVACGCFTDRDGMGHWAIDNALIDNSRVFGYYGELLVPPAGITHVVWYNK